MKYLVAACLSMYAAACSSDLSSRHCTSNVQCDKSQMCLTIAAPPTKDNWKDGYCIREH